MCVGRFLTGAGRVQRGARLAGGLAASLLVCLFPAKAGDWPQFRGPTHDGISTDRIVKQWSGSVTTPVWRAYFTNGLSSFAVSGGRAFTQVKRRLASTNKEVCVALSVTNGLELWATPVDNAIYPQGGVGLDDGPRTTPSVNDGAVYILSSYLKLYRLNATNGAVTWQKDLRAIYGGSVIEYQNAASPLVDNGLIYLNANCGTDTLLALRTSDGSLAWRAENEAMTHASPVLATIHGVRQVIFATQTGVISLNPNTGTRLWKSNYPFNYSVSLAPSPVVYQDIVFLTSHHGYGQGSVAWQARLTNNLWTTTRLWWTNNPAAHWMTPVCHEGFLYGQFGIQFQFDSTNAQLKCIDLRTGTVKWSTNGFGRGGTLLVDKHIVTLTERGHLVLVKPDTNAYTELGRFLAIPNWNTSNRCWNIPAMCDGRIYVRGTAQAACFDLAMPDLKMDPPEPQPNGTLQLTVRTTNGAPVHSSRLAGMEVRVGTNLALPLAQWPKLTNDLVLTNGVVRVENVEGGSRRYFIASEPP
jgi:outer membrane protein assembly factor BamB